MTKQTSTILSAICIVVSSVNAGLSDTGSQVRDYEEGVRAYKDRDYETSIEKWSPLAETGNADAQFSLGVLYQLTAALGILEPEFSSEGVKLIHEAALQGHAKAQNEIALIIKKNYPDSVKHQADAVNWMKLAANQGLASAQFELGVAFKDGIGVSQDLVLATSWFRLAAEQGHSDAQNSLAVRYSSGDGATQDFERAFFWFLSAAEKGNALAQFNLGAMFSNGQWVSQNLPKAYMWISLAADDPYDLGTVSADITSDPTSTVDQWKKAIVMLEAYMSKRQIDNAKAMATRCLNNKYIDC